MDNDGYKAEEGEGGLQELPLEQLSEAKCPSFPPPKVDETPVPVSRRRKVAPLEEPDSPTPDTLEDYSLISFLPNYQQHKKQFNDSLKDCNTGRWVKAGLMIFLTLLYCVYFLAALSIVSRVDQQDYWCSGDGFLLVLTLFVGLSMVYFLVIKKFFGRKIYKSLLKPTSRKFDEIWSIKVVRMSFYVAMMAALIIFLLVDTANNRQRLVSLIGLAFLIFFGFVFSAAPRAVVWRHVIWGLALQFIFGLLILRWSVGRAVFACAGKKVSDFLAFTDQGSTFVFGYLAKDPDRGAVFAFSVLPVVLFFSFCVSILYYYGIMQWVVIKLGWLLQVTVGTTAGESVNAAANIFLGQTEAPLVIKPFLPIMTKSELHAVLTGGFATIAGSVMAAYISFGVSASHLLSASVMSAPAALAYAKLFYPETEVSKTNVEEIPVVKSTEVNVLHAAIEGVVNSIPLVANIAANLIAFIAFIAFFNSIFNWSCTLIDIDDGVCSFENLFGYIFMPLAWMMGVKWSECHDVGTLIGIKTIVNEFVAFSELAKMTDEGTLSARSQIIATYALCGFSNIGSIGIQVGGLGALAPTRRADISTVVVRAMIAGSAACFLTGCIAGTLLDDDSLDPVTM